MEKIKIHLGVPLLFSLFLFPAVSFSMGDSPPQNPSFPQTSTIGPSAQADAPPCGCMDVSLSCVSGVLYVYGTENCNDVIRVTCSGNQPATCDQSMFYGTYINVHMNDFCPGAQRVFILGYSGNDKLDAKDACEGVGASIFGGGGQDKLRGTNENDLIQGQAGADHIFGLAGDDTLKGGNGNDRIDGGLGGDIIKGGSGADQLFSGGYYSAGASCLEVSRSIQIYDDAGLVPDQIFGDNGNDCIDARGGTSTSMGGLGHDQIKGWGSIGGDFGTESGTSNDGNDIINVVIPEACLDQDNFPSPSGGNYTYLGNGRFAVTSGDWVYEWDGTTTLEAFYYIGLSVVYGDGGHDRILGHENSKDEIWAGIGNDYVLDRRRGVNYNGGAGTDTLIRNGNDGFDDDFENSYNLMIDVCEETSCYEDSYATSSCNAPQW